jgi:hypothetical protein
MIPVVVIPLVRPSQWALPRWGSSIETVLWLEVEAIHAHNTAAADLAAKLNADGWNLTLSADGLTIVCVHPDIRTEEQATDRLVLLGFDFEGGCFYVGLERLQEAREAKKLSIGALSQQSPRRLRRLYNGQRRHSSLGYLSPREYEQSH